MLNFIKKIVEKIFNINYSNKVNIETATDIENAINNDIIPELEIIHTTENTIEELFNWEGDNLYKYHWWPMKEKSRDIDDPYNNIYSKSGPLSKWDYLFGTKCYEYQKEHYFRKYDSDKKDADWAGFCDCAAFLSCNFKLPIHSVKVNYNGKSIVLDIHNVEALMILISRNIVNNSIFLGKRYNHIYNDTSEPYPLDLIKYIKVCCTDSTPFILDVTNGTSVWNYPYNKSIITKQSYPPLEYDIFDNHTDKTDYYNFIIKSEAYPDKNINIWGWVNNSTNETTQGWLGNNPDFIWKQYKLEENKIQSKCEINPEINTKYVYKIYKSSITTGYDVNL